MKNRIKPVLSVLLITVCFAFSNLDNDGLIATYGVSSNDPSQIRLELREDFTFTYKDFSRVDSKIEVQGTYSLYKSRVLLNASDEGIKFHDEWKITDDGMTAKSRKGLCFYSLGLLN